MHSNIDVVHGKFDEEIQNSSRCGTKRQRGRERKKERETPVNILLNLGVWGISLSSRCSTELCVE
jgi:hypothetical protein